MAGSTKVSINEMASEIMKGLTEYADLAAEELKTAVKDAGKYAKNEIKATAPRDTGKYAKSWTSKTTKESSNGITVVVHSTNRYQLARLLEFGHAKRGGGRVEGKAHIASAEEKAIKKLEADIERKLEG